MWSFKSHFGYPAPKQQLRLASSCDHLRSVIFTTASHICTVGSAWYHDHRELGRKIPDVHGKDVPRIHLPVCKNDTGGRSGQTHRVSKAKGLRHPETVFKGLNIPFRTAGSCFVCKRPFSWREKIGDIVRPNGMNHLGTAQVVPPEGIWRLALRAELRQISALVPKHQHSRSNVQTRISRVRSSVRGGSASLWDQ